MVPVIPESSDSLWNKVQRCDAWLIHPLTIIYKVTTEVARAILMACHTTS